MDIFQLIDENSTENNPPNRKLNTFAPRLWRANEELAREIFEYKCNNSNYGGDICSQGKHHPFCKANMRIPYNADTFVKWFTTKDVEEINKWYWEYIEHCEAVRGEAATNCRSQESVDYLPPFPLDHFENYKLNFANGLGLLGR